jgi:hypothetical protein
MGPLLIVKQTRPELTTIKGSFVKGKADEA